MRSAIPGETSPEGKRVGDAERRGYRGAELASSKKRSPLGCFFERLPPPWGVSAAFRSCWNACARRGEGGNRRSTRGGDDVPATRGTGREAREAR